MEDELSAVSLTGNEADVSMTFYPNNGSNATPMQ